MTRTEENYRAKKEYLLIYSELIQAARHRGTVTYQELADLIGLPLQGSYMGTELGWYLGTISEDERRYGRPMLSAVTVTVNGTPGPGFFGLAKQMGIFDGEDKDAQQAFWESERRKVYETWQKSFRKEKA